MGLVSSAWLGKVVPLGAGRRTDVWSKEQVGGDGAVERFEDVVCAVLGRQ